MDLPTSAPVRPPAATMRQRLRAGLAPLHERLDVRITAVCLSPRADLRRLLAVHACALPPVVAGLRAAGAARLWPGWDGPARLAVLSAELGFGGALHGGASPPERFGNEAMAWGGLYALLGSRLGNKAILRRLAEAGEPADSAFLRHGADGGPEWRRFLDALEAAFGPAGGGAGACRDAIEGAALVMERYLDAVERLGRRAARIGKPLN